MPNQTKPRWTSSSPASPAVWLAPLLVALVLLVCGHGACVSAAAPSITNPAGGGSCASGRQRLEWQAAGHAHPPALYEDVFAAQPSVGGVAGGSTTAVLTHLLYELRDGGSSSSSSSSSGGCPGIHVHNASATLADVCGLAWVDAASDGTGGADRGPDSSGVPPCSSPPSDVVFDWDAAKKSVLLFDASAGQTHLPACRVHLALAQLPPGHVHRVSLPVAAAGRGSVSHRQLRIRCRVANIWREVASSGGDGPQQPSPDPLPDLLLPVLRGSVANALFVTPRLGFPESFVARAGEKTRAPSETAQATRRYGNGGGGHRTRARSAKELHDADQARHVQADLLAADVWANGLTFRIALTNDAFALFADRPFRAGVDNMWRGGGPANATGPAEEAATRNRFVSSVLASLRCHPLPCLTRGVKQHTAEFIASLPDHAPQLVTEPLADDAWVLLPAETGMDSPSSATPTLSFPAPVMPLPESPGNRPEEEAVAADGWATSATGAADGPLLDAYASPRLFFDSPAALASAWHDHRRFPPLLTPADAAFASPRTLVVHVAPRALARRGFHLPHRAELAALLRKDDPHNAELRRFFEDIPTGEEGGCGKLTVGTFALRLVQQQQQSLGAKGGSRQVIFPNGATCFLMQSFHAHPAPTVALRLAGPTATLDREVYIRRPADSSAALQLSWQCLLLRPTPNQRHRHHHPPTQPTQLNRDNHPDVRGGAAAAADGTKWADDDDPHEVYRQRYCSAAAYRSTIMLELTTGGDKVEWSSLAAKEALRRNSVHLMLLDDRAAGEAEDALLPSASPRLSPVRAWCANPRALATFFQTQFLERVDMFLSMPQDAHLVPRRDIALAEIEAICGRHDGGGGTGGGRPAVVSLAACATAADGAGWGAFLRCAFDCAAHTLTEVFGRDGLLFGKASDVSNADDGDDSRRRPHDAPHGTPLPLPDVLLSVHLPAALTAKRQPTVPHGSRPMWVRIAWDLPALPPRLPAEEAPLAPARRDEL